MNCTGITVLHERVVTKLHFQEKMEELIW